MPIQPIDLQNMFLKMSQIGKEQAEQRNIAAQQQAAQGSEFVKETEHKDHSVNKADDLPDGAEKTDEDGKRKGKEEQSEQKKREHDGDGENRKGRYLEDPDLGHHIDISG
jgi:hypothetical protein